MDEIKKKIDVHTMLNLATRPQTGGYLNYVWASFGLAMTTLLRRQRIILASVISLLPVLIPLALVFLSKSQFADNGNVVFVRMVEDLHIGVLAPLLALFFATMLVGEDVEMNTLTYILTRPIPRSAWVFGRFLAYLVVTSLILMVSVFLTFTACTALSHLSFAATDLKLLAHYCGVIFMSLLASGAVAMLLGALTKRPIVYGVLLLYAWQRLATIVPGLIDFFTIDKYIDAILPILATSRSDVATQTVLGNIDKAFFAVSSGKAMLALLLITATFLALTVWSVRKREYAGSRAAGA